MTRVRMTRVRMTRLAVGLAVVFLLTLPGTAMASPTVVRAEQAASFQGLGHLPGGSRSDALGISGDGSVVVGRGYTSEGAQRAFRWTAAGGLEDIGTLDGNATIARAASFDGTWIVGQSGIGFRWSLATGMEELPMGDAADVSDDGSVIVGFGLRWKNGEVTNLGGSSGCLCEAYGASGDGVVVVGWNDNGHPDPNQNTQAFRWTDATGFQDLGTLKEGSESIAAGANRDGSVIVGQATNRDGFWHAFRWTSGGGMVDLGTLRDGTLSAASAVSADGSVIVGRSLTTSSTGSNRAFRWTTGASKMEEVQQLLIDQGVTAVQDWILTTAHDVSADGKVIVGSGLNPNNQFEAWRAVLP